MSNRVKVGAYQVHEIREDLDRALETILVCAADAGSQGVRLVYPAGEVVAQVPLLETGIVVTEIAVA